MNRFLPFFSVVVGGGLAFAQETPEPADFPGDARLLLPPVIHALNGLEASVYFDNAVGSSRVDLQACKLEYSIVSPK